MCYPTAHKQERGRLHRTEDPVPTTPAFRKLPFLEKRRHPILYPVLGSEDNTSYSKEALDLADDTPWFLTSHSSLLLCYAPLHLPAACLGES